ENLNVFGKMRGMSREEIRQRSEELLEKLRIYDDRGKRIVNLSGGMKKRADLAACLLHDPKLVILDEPFEGIDPPQRQIIWENLQTLSQEGKILVITSHLLGDISDKCNKFGLLHDGEFYRTYQIQEMMEETDYQNIERFLNDVFRF
ncbi:MAG: ATP-binding cassette domain-containing protein, partial [Candidatus Aenigmatarchaeota archaeon]